MISQADIDKAVAILKRGGLVAFPTETVYGLGADARNPLALKKIFAAKGRPLAYPLIVHIADRKQLSSWAIDISADAYALADVFWPGPLTLILKKAPHVSDFITGHQTTIGIRIPAHPIAKQLLTIFGDGLAAPSANRFGHISPTTAAAVREELGEKVDLILDGGQCAVGVESTIVDVSSAQAVILRPGMVTAQQIEQVLQKELIAKKNNLPLVSGSQESHYAPRTKTRLIETQYIPGFIHQVTTLDLPLAILHYQQQPILHHGVEWIKMSVNTTEYAHDLYHTLRTLDQQHFAQIVIEKVPAGNAWDAIRDRITRASVDEIIL